MQMLTVTYRDLVTGESAIEHGISEFSLTENNWSCDCNRMMAFDRHDDSGCCVGCKRYIVDDVTSEGDPLSEASRIEIINHANSEYIEAGLCPKLIKETS